MPLRVLKPKTFALRGNIANRYTTLFSAQFFCLFLDLTLVITVMFNIFTEKLLMIRSWTTYSKLLKKKIIITFKKGNVL